MLKKWVIAILLILGVPLISAAIIDSDLQGELQNKNEIDVIILLEDDTTARDLILEVKTPRAQAELTVADEYPHLQAISATINEEALDILIKSDTVAGVFEDKEYSIFPTEETTLQTSISVPAIGALNAHTTYNLSGRNIVVAVLDTGIDYQHPALGACPAINATCRVRGGYDFVNSDNDPLDDNGHGTHVAGIIGANSSTLTGVAPQVQFLAYKVCNSFGSCPISAILAGVDAAIENNAQIISISLGGEEQPNNGQSILSLALNQAVAQGITVVVAAGNSGPSTGCVASPGDAQDVITVGNSNDKGTIDTSDDTISSSSCSGPSAFGRLDPDLVAPGTSITSSYLNNASASLSGTSMATPHVSGAAALLLEYNSTLTPAQIRSKLMQTATDIREHTFNQGAGLINVTRAIEAKLHVFEGATDRLEIITSANKTVNFAIHIQNYDTQAQVLTFTSTDLTDLEGNFHLPSTILNSVESFTINPRESTSTIANYTIPANATPAVYGGTIVVTSSDGKQYRLPVSLTVSTSSSELIMGTVNKARSTCSNSACGDKIWFAFNQSAAATTVSLNWTNTGNNLNLYLYNTSGGLLDSKTTTSTAGEQLTLPRGSPFSWIMVHSVRLITNNVNLSYNLSLSLHDESTTFVFARPLNNFYYRESFDLSATITDLNNISSAYYNVSNSNGTSLFSTRWENFNVETLYVAGHINLSQQNVADGIYTVSLFATDRLGNSSNESITFSVDKTVPILNSITQIPLTIAPQDIVSIIANISESNLNNSPNSSAVVLESNSTGSWINASMTKISDDLWEYNISSSLITSQKNIVYKVHVTDLAGNFISTNESNFTVENFPPTTQITNPINNSIIEVGSNISFISLAQDSDNNSIFYNWSISNGYTTSDANFSLQFNSTGTFNATLQVFDGQSYATNSSTFIITDTMAPSISQLQYPTLLHNERDGNNVSLNITLFDYSNISLLQITTNATYVGGCLNWTHNLQCTWNLTSLSVGTTTFTLNVSDLADIPNTYITTYNITLTSCSDGSQNGNEEGTDCGGSCAASCSSDSSAGSSSGSSSGGSSGGGGGGGSGGGSNKIVTSSNTSSTESNSLKSASLPSSPQQSSKQTSSNATDSVSSNQVQDSNKVSENTTSSNPFLQAGTESQNNMPQSQTASPLLGFTIFDTIKETSLNERVVAGLAVISLLGIVIAVLRYRQKIAKNKRNDLSSPRKARTAKF